MKILHIDCSPREESQSRRISAAIVTRLFAIDPGALVIRRDLGRDPLPHAQAGYATALSSPKTLASEQSIPATRLSEQLIQEVEAADVPAPCRDVDEDEMQHSFPGSSRIMEAGRRGPAGTVRPARLRLSSRV